MAASLSILRDAKLVGGKILLDWLGSFLVAGVIVAFGLGLTDGWRFTARLRPSTR